MATTVEITSGYITIPNPVRQRDPFSVTFTFKSSNILPESFTYQVVGYDTAGTSFTIMGQWHQDFVTTGLFGLTKTLTCDGNYSNPGGCGFYMDPNPPDGSDIQMFVKVIPDTNPNAWMWRNICGQYENDCSVGNSVPLIFEMEGSPKIAAGNLPIKVTPLQEVTFNFQVQAYGTVDYPEYGIMQTDGPTIQYKVGAGSWTNLTSTPHYSGPLATSISGGSYVDVSLLLRMPDAGLFDSNTGKTATIALIPARQATDWTTNIPYEPIEYRSTFIQKTVTTCTQDDTRCVDDHGVLNAGCIRQICNNNVWQQVIANDPSCSGCGVTNHTCTGKTGQQVPAGTQECGHDGQCYKSTCSGITGLWENPVKDTTCGSGTTCANPVCTSGTSSCDSNVTHGESCTKYDCVSGQWKKSTNPGIMDCGTTCAVKNPLVIGGIAVGVVALAAIFYLVSTSTPSQSQKKTYSRWEAPDYPRQRRR
jgi:hypothetical protein